MSQIKIDITLGGIKKKPQQKEPKAEAAPQQKRAEINS